MKYLALFICWCIFSIPTFAAPLDYYYEQQLLRSHKETKKIPPTLWYDQLIDHDNPDAGQFKQRYYINDTYQKNISSPVFFYLCGESACQSNRVTTGAIVEQAKKFGAVIVALEHRYYGKSQPMPNLEANNLRYLTTEQALKDAEKFQKYLMLKKNWVGKWVAFGGSYPGSLSAYYRLINPALVTAALASSAPVRAEENFTAYDRHVAKQAGPLCLANIKNAVTSAEQKLLMDKDLSELKTLFQAEAITNNQDLLYMIADVAAAAVQYGMRDEFCHDLTTEDTPLSGYAKFARKFFKRWQISAQDLTSEGAKSIDAKNYEQGLGMRAWFYQSCTEYGYWQNANTQDELSARSSMINADYHHHLCKRLFNIDTPADTDKINRTYYFPLQHSGRSSHIYFTNGATDPWSTLSLTASNGNTGNTSHAYQVIPGAAHCDDLHASQPTDSVALKHARIDWQKKLASWLFAGEE